jgi:hypothetical protein
VNAIDPDDFRRPRLLGENERPIDLGKFGPDIFGANTSCPNPSRVRFNGVNSSRGISTLR